MFFNNSANSFIVVFFFWPAAETLYYSVLLQDAFASKVQFVWLDNFTTLFNDPHYLASFKLTALFSAVVAFSGLVLSLLLAVLADRVLRGANVYKTLLIWPYAVAPAVAGVLWLFLLSPSIGILTYTLRGLGIDWNYYVNGTQALLLVSVAAVWKQLSYNFLFFLAGLQAIPTSLLETAAIGVVGIEARASSKLS